MTNRLGEKRRSPVPTESSGPGGRPGRIGLICLILGLFGAYSAWGQTIRGGVRAGPTFGFLNDQAVPFVSSESGTTGKPHARVDFHAGAFGIVSVSEQVGLQLDVLYLRKGGHSSELETVSPGGPVYVSEQVQLSYLQGQMLARRDIWSPGPISFHAMAGVSVDVAISGRLHRDVRTREQVVHEKIPLVRRGLVPRWGVGAVVGGAVGYPLGMGRRVALDVRYNPGFRSVLDGRADSRGQGTSIPNAPLPLMDSPAALRHDVLTVGVSYTLPFQQ